MIQEMIQNQKNFFLYLFKISILCVFFCSCQSTLKEPALEFEDLTNRFQKLDPQIQQNALQNKWNFFTNTFSFDDFEKKMLEEFPSLNAFPVQHILSGKTFLNLALNTKRSSHPAVILLAIDLEMELLARYHSSEGARSPRCLEAFWSEWALPIPYVSRGPYIKQDIDWEEKTLDPKPALSNSSTPKALSKPLTENETKMSSYLKSVLNLDKNLDLEVLTSDELKSAQFKLKTGEVYQIFSSPLSCKDIASKDALLPLIGKLTCLQKKSSTWVVFLSQENPYLNDKWSLESQRACQRWIRPLSDILHKKHREEIQKSPLYKSWSLYPRLRERIIREADRFEAAYRNSLK